MEMDEEKLLEHEKDLQRIKELRLMDDDFMTMVFDGNIEGIQLILNIILGRSDIVVKSVATQSEKKNVIGHSARFDVHAVDSSGLNFDVEIQRADQGASAQRARYNSAMLDSSMLKSGQGYSELHDSYVIFITENDVLKAGLPLYRINRWVEDTKEPFGDGSHIIYANGAYQDEEDDIGKLMHDFRCTKPEDMYYGILADRVRYFKETEGGQETMCRAMEEMREEAATKAAHDSRVEMAEAMLKDGLECQTVSKYSGLSLEEVEKLVAQKTA